MDDLFDYGRERERRDRAMRDVEDHNEPSPNDVAYADAVALLPRLPSMVASDTIIPDLERYGFSDNRAVGPIILRLQRDGLITPTAGFRKSKRSGNHLVPIRVYQNNLCMGCGQDRTMFSTPSEEACYEIYKRFSHHHVDELPDCIAQAWHAGEDVWKAHHGSTQKPRSDEQHDS